MGRIRVTIGWILLGLAGVALAVGITMAATSVTSQRIGLESEPLSAGSELVPTTARTATVDARPARTTPARTQTQAAPPSAAPPPATTPPVATPPVTPPATDDDASDDDDGGKGRGRGRGGDDGEDDD